MTTTDKQQPVCCCRTEPAVLAAQLSSQARLSTAYAGLLRPSDTCLNNASQPIKVVLTARPSMHGSIHGMCVYKYNSMTPGAGIGVASTGHCHPKVVKAIQDQAAQFIIAQQNIFTGTPSMVRLSASAISNSAAFSCMCSLVENVNMAICGDTLHPILGRCTHSCTKHDVPESMFSIPFVLHALQVQL